MSGPEFRTDLPTPRSLEQEFLVLTLRNVLRNPLPVFVGIAVIAIAAMGNVPSQWVISWVSLSAIGLFGRALLIRHIIQQPRYTDQQRLRFIYFSSFINAVILCLSLAFFPWMSVIDAVLVTLVMGFLVIGVVVSNAGFAEATTPYVFVVSISLAIMWALFPHSDGDGTWKAYALSAFIVFMNFVLISVSKDIHRLFSNSVEMRLKYADVNRLLLESLAESRAANAAKTRFLAAASHDLRQPVHTLSLLTAALMSRNASNMNTDDRVTEITDTMDKALHSLAVQLDSLLDISKLDAGVITAKLDDTDVTVIARGLKREFLSFANEKQLSINLDAPEPVIAFTDGTLLERLLRNLIANAIKYTEVGQIDLNVSCGNDVVITIKDTGIGIAQDQQKLVFEEFYQIDNPHRDRSKGLGLGLSIVSRLCLLLDVKLELQSNSGEGTEFTLRLNKGSQIETEAQQKKPVYSFSRLRVLVVDDETDILLATKIYLEALDCVVLSAETTEEALELARTQSPELAIVDLRLRNHDSGIDALEAIRSLHPNIPAIMITGDTAPDRLREASSVNAKLLHKPIYSDQMQAAIQEVLRDTAK
ncbi:MAG: hybrid sensor histidine kinase/response regulator [Arenicella sp.]|nr:hybrid sensor histidine kinase/response regulator [Arenicella sp.]